MMTCLRASSQKKHASLTTVLIKIHFLRKAQEWNIQYWWLMMRKTYVGLWKTSGMQGYIVHTATCGRDAITIFRDIKPRIVLMDFKLPDINGLDLLKQMKREIPDTEVIIITGHADMELAIKSFQCDATDFVTKPLGRDNLEHALGRAAQKIFVRRRLQEYAENKAMREMVINELVNDDVLVIGADYRIMDINVSMLNKLGVDAGSSHWPVLL